MPPKCASGSVPIPKTARVQRARSSRATAATTSRPRWPPVRASFRATSVLPPSMPNTRPDPLYNKEGMKPKKAGLYRPEDFDYDRQAGTCICPAGKVLYQNGANCIHNGYIAVKFQGAQRDCIPCTERDKCLRTPEKTKTRQVCFFRGKADPRAENYSDIMKRAIDIPVGDALGGRRFATVEPVFGNIRYKKGVGG